MVQVALERKIPLLSNPPLVEAIFELRWELQGDEQTGRFRDPAYPMMYGRLYERLKKDFPLIEDLPSVQAHPETTPFVVRHRLRKERNGWPILQIGPGVATINDAKLYSWATFKPMISELISSILELYPRSVKPLNFIKAELRYINGIPFDSANPLDFLGEKLHMELDVPFEGAPNGVSLNLAYPINQPPSNLMVSANLGSVDGRAAYVVQNAVQSMGETVPQDDLGFEEWLLNAHKVASSSFVSLCKGSLMKQFGGL